ncbi:MAG: hypothetical protein CMP23_03005 [Rickettsiales bacterium]|nr:hypothetical protein [Rickettsiales bacterium]
MPQVNPLVEAVPNFSEGRDQRVIDAIAAALDGAGSRVLHVDPNVDANRTVVTLAGPLSAVMAALHRGVGVALNEIDMRKQQGAHLRIGAADVLPVVCLESGEAVRAACRFAVDQLAEQLVDDYQLSLFLYESSARRPDFAALPRCRKGGYEALPDRFVRPDDGPDLGPGLNSSRLQRQGASVLGLRELLVAMNFTLDSEDLGLAREIARAIRSSGPADRPHALPHVRSLGWKMDGYAGKVQVSVNLLRVEICPAHRVLNVIRQLSPVPVLGAELIGLAPARVFRDAGLIARGAEPPPDSSSGVLNPAAALNLQLLEAGAEYLGLDHLRAFRLSEDVGMRTLEGRLIDVGLLPPASG